MIKSRDASVDVSRTNRRNETEDARNGRHSFAYIAAISLIDGEITDCQFGAGAVQRSEVWKNLSNMKVEHNTELSTMYPDE